MTAFDVRSRVRIAGGSHIGRTGEVVKLCGRTFAEFRRVLLDPKPRERTSKVEMIDVAHLQLLVSPAHQEWLTAACWAVFVADRLGERLRRYARSERYPYDPLEALDYTAQGIYERARRRLAAARARLLP